MILLDFDNFNILVLFLLAFISFKSYQADHHAIESQSDQEMSEIDNRQSNPKEEEKCGKSVSEGYQTAKDGQKKSQSQLQPEMINVQNIGLQTVIDEEAEILQNDRIPRDDIPIKFTLVQSIEQVNNEFQNKQDQNQNNSVSEYEKCYEEALQESSSTQKNPESQSLDEEEDDEDNQRTNLPMEKMKKIHKLARKLKRDLKKEAELTNKLREEIQIQ